MHIYIGKYSIQNLCVFFRTSLGCRCLKKKENKSNKFKSNFNAYDTFIYSIYNIYNVYVEICCTLGKNNGLVIDKKNIKENKQKLCTQESGKRIMMEKKETEIEGEKHPQSRCSCEYMASACYYTIQCKRYIL